MLSQQSRLKVILALSVTAIWLAPHSAAAGVWDRLIRAGTRVADDVPIRQADDFAQNMARSKSVREALAKEIRAGLRRTGQADDAAAYARQVSRLLREEAGGLDPTLVRQLDALDTPAQEIAVILQRGSRRLSTALPDLAQRARLVRDGGPETVAALGMFGDELVDSTLRLDTAIRAGKVISPTGMRAATMADFGQLFVRHGPAAERFWTRYVASHWKAWLAGGALGWYLLDPDGFMNTAGELSEEGFKRLTQATGDATAIAIRGIGSGAGEAVRKTGEALRETYFSNWNGLAALAGTLLLLAVTLRGTRYYLLWPVRWLMRRPRADRAAVRRFETESCLIPSNTSPKNATGTHDETS